MTVRTLVAVLIVGLLAAACNGDDAPSGGDAAELAGSWVLVSGNGDGVEIPIVDGYRITLSIEGESVGGTAACNLYSGDAEIEGGSLRLGELAITDRGCEPAVMASEQAYLAALTSANAIRRDGDELVLSGPAAQLRFEALPAVPTAELIGTVWVLETLIEGSVATSATGEPATIELRVDGTLAGSTGCRTLTGSYMIRGDEVLATRLAADGECPPELARQDGHVVTVLGDGFTVAIDGDRLTLSSQGGLASAYRAR